MNVAVITPYYKEHEDELRHACQSVVWQDLKAAHIMIADGHPNPNVAGWGYEHIVLPSAHRDAGNFARGVGVLHAFQSGADYVCFLDADNWLESNHVSSLCRAMV